METTRRRLAGGLFLAGFLAFALAAAAESETSMVRFPVGKMEVTALSDGFLELSTSLFHDPQGADFTPLLTAKGITPPKLTTSLNVFLVKSGKKLILIDSGAGTVFGPTLGKLPSALKAAGVSPERIDAILLTHLHGDHVGGLLDDKGQRLYPNATVYLAQAEHDFYLGKDAPATLPEAQKGSAEIARKMAAPYIQAGKWQPFAPGALPIDGITALSAPGHTAGHTVYMVASEGHKLLLMGDLLHSAAIQFARPEVTVDFDFNQDQARRSRKNLFLERASKDKTLVAGAHLPFPGVGTLRAAGVGYVFEPLAR